MPKASASASDTSPKLPSSADVFRELTTLLNDSAERPDIADATTRLNEWRLRAARGVRQGMRRKEDDGLLSEIQAMLRELGRHIIADHAVPTELVTLADDYAREGAGGM